MSLRELTTTKHQPQRPWSNLWLYAGCLPSSSELLQILASLPSSPLILFSLSQAHASPGLVMNIVRCPKAKQVLLPFLYAGCTVRVAHVLDQRPYHQSNYVEVSQDQSSSPPPSARFNSMAQLCDLVFHDLPSETSERGFEILSDSDQLAVAFRSLVQERIWLLEKGGDDNASEASSSDGGAGGDLS